MGCTSSSESHPPRPPPAASATPAAQTVKRVEANAAEERAAEAKAAEERAAEAKAAEAKAAEQQQQEEEAKRKRLEEAEQKKQEEEAEIEVKQQQLEKVKQARKEEAEKAKAEAEAASSAEQSAKEARREEEAAEARRAEAAAARRDELAALRVAEEEERAEAERAAEIAAHRRNEDAEEEARRVDAAAALRAEEQAEAVRATEAAAEAEAQAAAARRAEAKMLVAMQMAEEEEQAEAERAAEVAVQKRQRDPASVSPTPACASASPKPERPSVSPESSSITSTSRSEGRAQKATTAPRSDAAGSAVQGRRAGSTAEATSAARPASENRRPVAHAPGQAAQYSATTRDAKADEAAALAEAVRRGQEAARGRRPGRQSGRQAQQAPHQKASAQQPAALRQTPPLQPAATAVEEPVRVEDATTLEINSLTRMVQEELAASGAISSKTRQELKKSQGLLSLLSSFTTDNESLALSQDSSSALGDSFAEPVPAAAPVPYGVTLSAHTRAAIKEALEDDSLDEDPEPLPAPSPSPSPTRTSASPTSELREPSSEQGTSPVPPPARKAVPRVALPDESVEQHGPGQALPPAAERLARLAGARGRTPRAAAGARGDPPRATERVVTNIDMFARMMGQSLGVPSDGPPGVTTTEFLARELDDGNESGDDAPSPMPRLASPAPTAQQSSQAGSVRAASGAASTQDGRHGTAGHDDSDDDIPQPSSAALTPQPLPRSAGSPSVSPTALSRPTFSGDNADDDIAPEPSAVTPTPSVRATSFAPSSPTLTAAPAEKVMPPAAGTTKTGLSRLSRMMRGGAEERERLRPAKQDVVPPVRLGAVKADVVRDVDRTASLTLDRSTPTDPLQTSAASVTSGGSSGSTGGLSAIVKGTAMDLAGMSLPAVNPTAVLENVVLAMRPVLTEFRGGHASALPCPPAATQSLLDIFAGAKGGAAKDLQVLDLTGWLVGDGKALVAFLKSGATPKLRSVVLADTGATGDIVAAVFAALPASVKHLNLHGCTLTAEAVTAALRGMPGMNTALEQLDLSYTGFPPAALSTLGMLLRKCRKLTHLSLAGNPFGADGSELLATMLLTSAAKVVVLHGCRLAAPALKRVLARANTVVTPDAVPDHTFPALVPNKVVLYSTELPPTPAVPPTPRTAARGQAEGAAALRKVMRGY